MAKLKITQVRSAIGRSGKQQETLKCLGLNRIGRSRVWPDDAATQGRINLVSHLVKVEAAPAEDV